VGLENGLGCPLRGQRGFPSGRASGALKARRSTSQVRFPLPLAVIHTAPQASTLGTWGAPRNRGGRKTSRATGATWTPQVAR
jgi:hypothetical protein